MKSLPMLGRSWVVIAVLTGSVATADDNRAHVNYMLHCQGCHLPDAVGIGDEVPRMKDFLGYFLHDDRGREFVVQVPGVATAQLPDDEIAELLNWLLLRYSGDQLPENYVPYTAAEVGALRRTPVSDPAVLRRELLRVIADAKPSLRSALQEYRQPGEQGD